MMMTQSRSDMDTILILKGYSPSPAAMAQREQKIALKLQELGSKWRLHPDNWVKRKK